jgi:hypothetical protein
MKRSTAAAAVLVFAALFAGAAPAHADDSFKCEVVEIDATKVDEAKIDSSLKDLSKYLTKGPLAIYNHFVKLGRTSKALEPLKSASYPMAKGTVTVMIREVRHPESKAVVTSLDIGIDDEHGTRWLDAKQNVSIGKYGNYIRSVSSTEGIVYFVGCK